MSGPKRRERETAHEMRNLNYAASPLLAAKTPPGRSKFLVALVGIGFAASRGEAKRLIAGGGARIDGEGIADEGFHIPGGTEVRISAGKKKHGVLRPVSAG